MSNHDAAERAYVAVWCDHADAQLADHQARMAAEVDELRTTWSSGFEQQLADHQARMAEIRKSIHGEPAPTPEPAQQIPPGASRSGGEPPVAPGPPGSAGQPDPHAAEVTAQDIAGWSMAEYQVERERRGIDRAASRGLFG